jgi:hypothetical protein
VAQQFLHRSNVVAVFQQMSGERMPQCVTARMARETGGADGLLDRSLDDRFVHVPAMPFAGLLVAEVRRGRENPLPGPIGCRGRVFAVERFRQKKGTLHLIDKVECPRSPPSDFSPHSFASHPPPHRDLYPTVQRMVFLGGTAVGVEVVAGRGGRGVHAAGGARPISGRGLREGQEQTRPTPAGRNKDRGRCHRRE